MLVAENYSRMSLRTKDCPRLRHAVISDKLSPPYTTVTQEKYVTVTSNLKTYCSMDKV